MTIQTAGGLVDNYDIRGVHDLFRDRFPKVERREATDISGTEQPGSIIELTAQQPFFRWWFVSDDSSQLIQCQENLFARNWRRQAPANVVDDAYPGFARFRSEFAEQIETLRSARDAALGELPDPIACELLYDNFIPLQKEDGSLYRLQDILSFLNMQPPRQLTGFQMIWTEAVPDPDVQLLGQVRVHVSVAHASVDGSPAIPIIRLMFAARAPISSWGDAFRYFDLAHSQIRTRFIELTTEACHTRWGWK